jgi:hypothetical protein
VKTETVGGAAGFAADLSTTEAAEELVRRYPEIDILVNNLAIFEPKPVDEILDSEWVRFFEVNIITGVRLTRLYPTAMRRANWGRIIFISSESALQIPAEMIHYGITKTTLIALARRDRCQYRHHCKHRLTWPHKIARTRRLRRGFDEGHWQELRGIPERILRKSSAHIIEARVPLLVTSASGANGDGHGTLLAFYRDGRSLGAFSNDRRIADPRGLAVNRNEGLLFLNSGTDRVLALGPDGRVVRDTGPIKGLNPGGGNLGPDGRYYVGSRSTRTIVVFPTALNANGEHFLQAAIMPFPRGFAFDHDGTLFLTSGQFPQLYDQAIVFFSVPNSRSLLGGGSSGIRFMAADATVSVALSRS